jgi:hypothetical protein
MAEYPFFDVVKAGIDAANVRVPRLQKGVANEFGAMLSDQVKRSEWTRLDGSAVNLVGQDVYQYLDHCVAARPFWLVPATVVDAADTTWLEGSLEAQGKRWRELKAFLGSDAATNAAMAAEAALYGVKPGTTQKGTKPGTRKPDDSSGAPPPHRNPWHPDFPGSPEDRLAAQTSILTMKNGGGSKAARDLAFAAGVTISGQPLKR